MPKTANDPLFATQRDPASSGRHAKVVTPSDTIDLSDVTSNLIITTGTGATGIAVIFADDADSAPVTIPLPVGVCIQLQMQARRIMANGTNLGAAPNGIVATWG
ncbi:spike base protein, RCAP_Rcc01079 family [Bradyrhizobium japonicum]|uniref:spike base protein, RCAP_Rcc01079 family n=1 Tax=Bradyrhizobium japonicum TaxID=375 RepID=UPI00057F5765|nr:hypothetical protein [Bradyrhizobium japonicum]MCD9110271.1 hypothetical protein [Bradyrhizobium japonicum]MCD9257450.1 hypothetical protein [Bradyrhizobium japonicum SEMIA 5079]MCD9823511.1 hypothetical protein [Bradyrhizobium japonicum]MCD9895114.1 hypothetical protein [Bradyrhizobium japonicum]MCD9910720.1 hypothetical protein [Bradyrhizobium japonicum]